MKVDRVVLDTSVLISAALSKNDKPFQCLTWALDFATIIISSALLNELETRLARAKFDKYISPARRKAFLSDITLSALSVPVVGTIKACRDPDDDMVLETAIVGQANAIVTGDQDLLALHPFHGIPIIAPAGFLSTVVQAL